MKKERNLHNPLTKFSYKAKELSSDTDVRIYRDTILLTPGEFTDSMSMSPVAYTEEAISKSADKWEENYLNLDHSYEVLKRLGFVMNTYYKDEDKKVEGNGENHYQMRHSLFSPIRKAARISSTWLGSSEKWPSLGRNRAWQFGIISA